MSRSGSHLRLLAALALFGALGLGVVGHLWHHLHDPDCGPDGRHGSQPCATCSALHSVPTPAHAHVAVAPVARASHPVVTAERGGPTPRPSLAGAARAPPQA